MGEVRKVQFNMSCPKCKANNWKLEYRGDADETCCSDTKTIGRTSIGGDDYISAWIGDGGAIIITCLKCGYYQKIPIGGYYG